MAKQNNHISWLMRFLYPLCVLLVALCFSMKSAAYSFHGIGLVIFGFFILFFKTVIDEKHAMKVSQLTDKQFLFRFLEGRGRQVSLLDGGVKTFIPDIYAACFLFCIVTILILILIHSFAQPSSFQFAALIDILNETMKNWPFAVQSKLDPTYHLRVFLSFYVLASASAFLLSQYLGYHIKRGSMILPMLGFICVFFFLRHLIQADFLFFGDTGPVQETIIGHGIVLLDIKSLGANIDAARFMNDVIYYSGTVGKLSIMGAIVALLLRFTLSGLRFAKSSFYGIIGFVSVMFLALSLMYMSSSQALFGLIFAMFAFTGFLSGRMIRPMRKVYKLHQ